MSKPVVIVADDSRLQRAVVRSHLEADYEIVEAADGDEALQRCRERQPAALLLDVEMPALDGHEVLRAMKADPEMADIPVVFLTGNARTEDVVRGLEEGAHDYLRKPFEPTELQARVRAAVRMKALQDELRRRNAELETISRTDALTGLANRRRTEECLGVLGSAARRHGHPLAALILDIDHFKAVNDTYGHAAGDRVLREVAARLQAEVRREDLTGRWGGEEFLVLAPMTDETGVAALGERLRKAVEAEPFDTGSGRTLPITISVGAAAGGAADPEAMIRRADGALYAAKAAGRNRVSVAPSPVPSASAG
jgi:two-component system cell cycle response regulator